MFEFLFTSRIVSRFDDQISEHPVYSNIIFTNWGETKNENILQYLNVFYVLQSSKHIYEVLEFFN